MYVTKKIFFRLIFILPLLVFNACTTTNRVASNKDVSGKWHSLADSLQEKMYDTYLSNDKKYYAQDNVGNQKFHYWHNAHVLDVLVDGYERTRNAAYIPKMNVLLSGMYATNNNSLINDYYDDMAWLGLSTIRAYHNTKDKKFLDAAKTLWQDILTGINNNDGRSLSWSKPTPEFKNTPANGPAIMMGLRLYKITNDAAYRDTAVMFYNWLTPVLINPANGLSWDGIKNGELVKAMYTYNQGLYIGASVEMYHLTKDIRYLNNAIQTAKGSINSTVISPNGILKPEGQGDGGLFKGIFVRYFVQLIKEKNINKEDKKLLTDYVIKNAETLYSQGIDHNNLLINYDWNKKPSGKIDLSTQLSGMMLIEAMAELKKLNLVP